MLLGAVAYRECNISLTSQVKPLVNDFPMKKAKRIPSIVFFPGHLVSKGRSWKLRG